MQSFTRYNTEFMGQGSALQFQSPKARHFRNHNMTGSVQSEIGLIMRGAHGRQNERKCGRIQEEQGKVCKFQIFSGKTRDLFQASISYGLRKLLFIYGRPIIRGRSKKPTVMLIKLRWLCEYGSRLFFSFNLCSWVLAWLGDPGQNRETTPLLVRFRKVDEIRNSTSLSL